MAESAGTSITRQYLSASSREFYAIGTDASSVNFYFQQFIRIYRRRYAQDTVPPINARSFVLAHRRIISKVDRAIFLANFSFSSPTRPVVRAQSIGEGGDDGDKVISNARAALGRKYRRGRAREIARYLSNNRNPFDTRYCKWHEYSDTRGPHKLLRSFPVYSHWHVTAAHVCTRLHDHLVSDRRKRKSSSIGPVT